MGGGGGGGYNPVEFDDLEKRILERLQGIARSAKKVILAAEQGDQRALASHMARSGIQVDEKFAVLIGPDSSAATEMVKEAQVLVVFTDAATDTSFLDGLVETAFAAKVQGIHAKAHAGSRVPSKILAYRLRSMTWDDLVALLR